VQLSHYLMQKILWSSWQQAPNRMLNKTTVPKLLAYCPKFSDVGLLLARNLSNAKVSNPPLCSLKTELRKTSDEALPVAYGQPTSSSHPHLLADGEILPGIGLAELQSRRWKLLESLQHHSFNLEKRAGCHTVVIPSATKRYMSDKIPYVFRQNSDFLYFAGCLEPDSVLVLQIDEDNKAKSVMFVR
jgi:Xaa-Pro aminopeptidase